MKITIKRKQNVNYWLFSQITIDNKFICDTLEMGDGNQLSAGNYSLEQKKDNDLKTVYISITDSTKNEVSKIVQDNVMNWFKWKLRNQNNWLSVGINKDNSLLAMSDYSFKFLNHLISKAILQKESINLVIID